MSITTYSADFILFLRDSPLSEKPKGLTDLDSFMVVGRHRNEKTPTDRTKFDSSVLDSRRTSDRNSRNHDDSIGNFRSGVRLGSDSGERFSHIRSHIDGDGDRSRGERPHRRRDDQEGDSWNTVRPGKSFVDSSDKFTGRMGGSDRFSDRRARDQDRDHDEEFEGRRLHNNSKTKGEWSRNSNPEGTTLRPNERLNVLKTSKNWRDREESLEESSSSNHRNFERKWGRDVPSKTSRGQASSNNEEAPAWMDDKAAPQGHSAEDLKDWLNSMRAGDKAANSSTQQEPTTTSPKVVNPPKIDLGPDHFLAQDSSETRKVVTGGKSRFMNLLPTDNGPVSAPLPGHNPLQMTGSPAPPGLGQPVGMPLDPQAEAARAQLMYSLKIGNAQSVSPMDNSIQAPPTPAPTQITTQQIMAQAPPPGLAHLDNHGARNNSTPGNDPFQSLQAQLIRQYGGRESSMPSPHQGMHDMMTPQQPSMSMHAHLQHLVGARSVQGNRMESAGSNSSNNEYLMSLMRGTPDSQDSRQPHQQPQQSPMPPPPHQSAPPMLQQQPSKPPMPPMPPMQHMSPDEFLMQQRLQQLSLQSQQQQSQQQQQGRGMSQMGRGGGRIYMDNFSNDSPESRQGPTSHLLPRGPSIDQLSHGPGVNPAQWMSANNMPQQQQHGIPLPPPGLMNNAGPGNPHQGPPGMFPPGGFPMPGFPHENMPPGAMPPIPNGLPGGIPNGGPRMPPPNVMYGGGPPMNFFNNIGFQGPPGGPGPDMMYGPGPNGPGMPFDGRSMPMGAPQQHRPFPRP